MQVKLLGCLIWLIWKAMRWIRQKRDGFQWYVPDGSGIFDRQQDRFGLWIAWLPTGNPTNGKNKIMQTLYFKWKGSTCKFYFDDRYEINAMQRYRFSQHRSEYVQMNGRMIWKQGGTRWLFTWMANLYMGNFTLKGVDYNVPDFKSRYVRLYFCYVFKCLGKAIPQINIMSMPGIS